MGYNYSYFLLFCLHRLPVPSIFFRLISLKRNFINKKQWVEDINKLAGDRPVVFTNSYQRPAVYTFYTGKFATYAWIILAYRKTQYDIWNFEEMVHGKQVLYVPHFFNDYYKHHLTKRNSYKRRFYICRTVFKDFQSLQKECVILE